MTSQADVTESGHRLTFRCAAVLVGEIRAGHGGGRAAPFRALHAVLLDHRNGRLRATPDVEMIYRFCRMGRAPGQR